MSAGRPTKYDSNFCEIARKLCLLGHTDKDLAKFFEISVSTLNNWKIDYPEFLESLNAGKVLADSDVAEGLYKRATGFAYEEVTFEKIMIKEGDGTFMKPDDADNDDIRLEPFKKKVVLKEIAPDPGAALSWLKNRQPKKWRDKQEIDHTTGGEKFKPTPIIFVKSGGDTGNG
jgi:hypothetical protein